MRRAFRWTRNALVGLIVLIAIAASAVYAVSETTLRRTYQKSGTPVAIPSDSASIAEGQRLAQIRGCTGCHGSKLEGQMFVDEPILARLAAPSLTLAARQYSDAELERIIRHGVRPDNRSVVGMPSEMFRFLDDNDMGRIIAFVRSVPQSAGQKREMHLGPLARVAFALRQFSPAAMLVQRAESLDSAYPPRGDSTARGAYIARTVCTECHGLDLTGSGKTPDLIIAASYSREQFMRLRRTGKPLQERELRLMSDVARKRFSHMTDDEIDALHRYLIARASRY